MGADGELQCDQGNVPQANGQVPDVVGLDHEQGAVTMMHGSGYRGGGGGHRSRTNGTRRNQNSPSTPTTGLCERGNDTSQSTGRSGRQNAATRRNMRREERVPVQGPVKEQQPDGMSHRGGGGGGVKNESHAMCLAYRRIVCNVMRCESAQRQFFVRALHRITAKGAYGNGSEELFGSDFLALRPCALQREGRQTTSASHGRGERGVAGVSSLATVGPTAPLS